MGDDIDILKHFQQLLDNQTRSINDSNNDRFNRMEQRFNKIDEKLDKIDTTINNHEVRLVKIEDHIEYNKPAKFGFDNILKYGQPILFLAFLIFYLGATLNHTQTTAIEKSVSTTSSLLNGNLPSIPEVTKTARSTTVVNTK
jgi:hypothetical protein